jgi:hypothetical protein
VTAFRSPPERHWRSYGTEPLPTAADALQQPLRAFPSWFLRIECERCFKEAMLSEAAMSERNRNILLCVLISRISHGSCGGRVGRAELLSGIDDVSGRPVRRIVMMDG